MHLSSSSRTITPWKIAPATTAPWTIATKSNCPLDNSLAQFPPKTIVLPPDSYTQTITAYDILQFFHGYFLFHFHDLII